MVKDMLKTAYTTDTGILREQKKRNFKHAKHNKNQRRLKTIWVFAYTPT